MSKAPHVQASFINALAEEGTREELVQYLQEQWNETCAAKAQTQAAVAVALEAAATLSKKAGNCFAWQIENDIRALITPAQHDALAAHVAAEAAKARAEWVGSHCKELTAADRDHIIAHLSYELEPVGNPPTWNQLAMEVVRLSNALAQIGAKP